MLFSPVFAKLQPRRTLGSFRSQIPTLGPLSPNSHGIISFADPHPLTLLESYRFKNIGGQGAPSTFPARNAQNPVAQPLFLSTSYKLQISQLLSFDIHANWWGGVWGASQHSNLQTCQPANLPTFFDLSPFLSYSCALFCTHQILNSLVFNRFRTLCKKPPGVGGTTPVRRSRRN